MAIVVPIVSTWDPRGVDRAMGDVRRAETRMGRLKAGAGALAAPAAVAVAAVGAVGLSAVKAAEEAAAAQSKLKQVYDSMGYPQLADDAAAYADNLAMQIGVDDEIIKGAQTKLATFSEVAKSAETMGRATSIAADLSAAGFGSMDSAAVMLGKALQDPQKGITALSRVGVTFTAQQKKQIAAMQAAGDMAGAQTLIMAALETQVGGVAEAGATASDKLAVGFGEVQEALGTALLPAFEALVPLLAGFADWASQNGPLLAGIAGTIAVMGTAVLAVNAAFAAWTAITTAWSVVMAIAEGIAWGFAAAVYAIGWPILAIIAAIAAVIAIGVLLYKNWDTVKAWAGKIWGWIGGFLTKTWQGIKSAATSIWNGLKAFFGAVFGAIKNLVVAYFTFYGRVIATVWNTIKAVITGVVNTIKNVISAGFNAVKGIVERVMAALRALFSGDFQQFAVIVKTGIDEIVGFFLSLPGRILDAVAGFGGLLWDAGANLIRGLVDGAKSVLSSVGGFIGRIIGGDSLAVNAATVNASPMAAGRAGRATTAPVVINISGAIDPYATARLVKKALADYDTVQGRPQGSPLPVAW